MPIICISSGVAVLSLGRIIDDPKYYKINCGSVTIFPLGFSMTRSIGSYITPEVGTNVTCSIREKKSLKDVDNEFISAPEFIITIEDDPENDIVADSASQAWSKLMERAGKLASINGPLKYGLTDKSIVQKISQLPGAEAVLARTKTIREKRPRNSTEIVENALKTPAGSTGELKAAPLKTLKTKAASALVVKKPRLKIITATKRVEPEVLSSDEDTVPFMNRLSVDAAEQKKCTRIKAKMSEKNVIAGKRGIASGVNGKPRKPQLKKASSAVINAGNSSDEDEDVSIVSKLMLAVTGGRIAAMTPEQKACERGRKEEEKAKRDKEIAKKKEENRLKKELDNLKKKEDDKKKKEEERAKAYQPRPVLCPVDQRMAKAQFDRETGFERKKIEKEEGEPGATEATTSNLLAKGRKKQKDDNVDSNLFLWPESITTRKHRMQYASFLWEFCSERAKVDFVKKWKLFQATVAASALGSLESSVNPGGKVIIAEEVTNVELQ